MPRRMYCWCRHQYSNCKGKEISGTTCQEIQQGSSTARAGGDRTELKNGGCGCADICAKNLLQLPAKSRQRLAWPPVKSGFTNQKGYAMMDTSDAILLGGRVDENPLYFALPGICRACFRCKNCAESLNPVGSGPQAIRAGG